MNGRAYDYNLGRFLSVDPIIQFPANSQSLNPYSYLMNNPMSGTDPSGYISCAEAVEGKVKGGCTSGESPSDPDSQWGKGKTIIGNYPGSGKSQSNGANQTASSASASTRVPEINSPSEAGKTNDASAETNPYGPYPPFSVTRNLESYAIAVTEPDHRMVSPELGFLISLGISAFSGTDGFSGENAPGDDSIEGGVFSPLGALKGIAAGTALGARAAKAIPNLADEIARTFAAGRYHSRVLQQDVVAYRYSGGISDPAGRFLTTKQTVAQIGAPSAAIQALNLPLNATAKQLNAFVIPRGTTIYYGRVAGGGERSTQIFIQDKSVLRNINE